MWQVDWLKTLVAVAWLGGMGCALVVSMLVVLGVIWLRGETDDR